MQTNPLTDDRPIDPSTPDLAERVRALELELQRSRELEAALRATLDETTRSAARLLESLRAEREAREHAEEESRLKNDFVAVLAHDLKTPLGNVVTAGRLLATRQDVPSDVQRRLERMIQSGLRMQRMIDQVADLTELRRGRPIVDCEEEHDLTRLVASVVAETRGAHPERAIELATDGAAPLIVDRVRVLQVLRTVIGNAAAHGAADRPVHVRVVVAAAAVHVEVHNEGPPIDEDTRSALHDVRRRRRTSASDGLGLGLYLSDRIVAAHGGELTIASAAERGTTVKVTLPARR
jgi:signal transduction histidine kinase